MNRYDNKPYNSNSAIFSIRTRINADELGDAICVSMSAPCGIETITFTENRAAHSGGAISSTNAPISIINCVFTRNIAGENTIYGRTKQKTK